MKMEIHHIVHRSNGGKDTEDNGIPLCFDCHAEVGAYNPQHPKGGRFTESELRAHKEQWFRIASLAPWIRGHIDISPATLRDVSVDRIVGRVRTHGLWDPSVLQDILSDVARLGHGLRRSLLNDLAMIIREELDDGIRQNAGLVVEFLVQWDPDDVSIELLADMASDAFFSVRSSAAVAFCYLARIAPAKVPLDDLARLATPDEDWYVMRPATTALLYLARTRGVAVEVLASSIGTSSDMNGHLAKAFLQLAKIAPAALREDIADRMIESGHTALCSVGANWKVVIEARRKEGAPLDHYIF